MEGKKFSPETFARINLVKDMEIDAQAMMLAQLRQENEKLHQEIDKLKREAANAQMAKNPKERES
jgi:BMFP domain-containing protein YqiC